MTDERTVTVALTSRELTLIRVSCLRRLNTLKGRDDMADSYEETRTLLNGKLWDARRALGGE